jgi:alpha-beta hydrolase superfamily lysophospholipase
MARTDEGFFSGKDDTRLYWRLLLPEAPKAILGIVHGYGDHSGRYLHVMQALALQNIGSVAFDYRGHGQADGRRADVHHFADYLEDLEVFWAKVRDVGAGKPTFLFAHSLGALIATHWAFKRPEGLAGLVLSAPFYKLAFEAPPLKLFGARMIKGLLPGLHLSNELKVEQLSTDVAWQQSSAADPLYLKVMTPRWFFETQAAQEQLSGRGKDLVCPVVFMAGGADPIASMPAVKAFFETVGSDDKQWRDYPGFRHELSAEVGKAQVISDIVEWISARC